MMYGITIDVAENSKYEIGLFVFISPGCGVTHVIEKADTKENQSCATRADLLDFDCCVAMTSKDCC